MLTIDMVFFLKFTATPGGEPGEWSHVTGQELRLTGADGTRKGPGFPLARDASPCTWLWVAMVITALP